MKKFFLTMLVAVAALSCEQKVATEEAPAQAEAAQTEAAIEGDLAYVRVDYVLAQSEIYKTEGVALQSKTEKAQQRWAKKEQDLQKKAAQLQEKYQKGLITTLNAQKESEAIEKRLAAFQTNTQKEAQTLEEENFVFNNRMNDIVMRAIKEINADGQFKMIVNATALLDAAESIDLSEKVLAKVNELYAQEKREKTAETK
jgi:outer membrane protein